MKTILVTAITILVAASVNAQPGMPQKLTCTEEAFNFNVSLGNNWKFTTPKMGPLEARSYQTGYTPAWSFKINQAAPETGMLPLLRVAVKANGLPGAVNRQNYGALFFPDPFSAADKPQYLWPVVNFGASANFIMFPSLTLSTTN